MRLPENFLASIENAEGFDRAAFEAVHASGEQVISVRVNPSKASIEQLDLPVSEKVPWTEWGYYLQQRPSFTFDPLFHAGCYYVQEASSMFLEQALLQCVDHSKPIKALDLCAAPGGKSTHLQSLLPEGSLLVSNEVIRNRSLTLMDNIVKWGAVNVVVSNNDPSAFGKLQGFFDLMVVDAPCSGSGLFRRDEEAIEEWSLNNVQLCYQRQQRILADALPALKENGLLLYSTCSYSREEDEEIADWLVNEMELQSVELEVNEAWNIVSTRSLQSKGYRFYPDKVKGEGFFMAVFRKIGTARETKFRLSGPEKASAKESGIILPWLGKSDLTILRDREKFLALPPALVEDYTVLKSLLKLVYAGIALGQIMKEKLVPGHALALSIHIAGNLPATELSKEMAIRYLQRQEINFNSSVRGWQLVRYEGHNLGWVNVLPNRINNYYPKEIRILKQSDDASFEK